jgi:hypothetical protein
VRITIITLSKINADHMTDTSMNKYFSILLFLSALTGCTTKDWRTASRESAGIAPSPETTKEAVLQVYGASTWGWRGWFAIHT